MEALRASYLGWTNHRTAHGQRSAAAQGSGTMQDALLGESLIERLDRLLIAPFRALIVVTDFLAWVPKQGGEIRALIGQQISDHAGRLWR